jgi:hypothetical protein
MRQFKRVVGGGGDVTNTSGNDAMLRKKGVHVDILGDLKGIASIQNIVRKNPIWIWKTLAL